MAERERDGGDAHEALVEKMARRFYEWRYAAFDWERPDETVAKDECRRYAQIAIALIAEETKEATAEMWIASDDCDLEETTAGEQWSAMHRASALWPKESK
jgi:hypothetical protein